MNSVLVFFLFFSCWIVKVIIFQELMIMCMIIKTRKTQSWPKLQDGVSEMEFTLPKGCSKFQVIEISSLEGKSLADQQLFIDTLLCVPALCLSTRQDMRKAWNTSLPRQLLSANEKTDNKTVCFMRKEYHVYLHVENWRGCTVK